MIELHRVSKVYSVGPVKVPALREVSFQIGKGEFVVLTGASGAGKTTLLRLLYRDDLPSDGDVEVFGHDLGALKHRDVAALRRSIGVVFQDAKLLPVRTVYENVAFVLRVLGTPKREITQRASRRARRSVRHWRGRSSASRRSSLPTSRRATSTRRWRTRSWACCATSGPVARRSCSRRTRRTSRKRSGDGRSRSRAGGS